MKYKNKIGAFIISICLLFPLFATVSQAASGSVSISSKSGNVGSTVTVTCTVKCSSGAIGSAEVFLTYDPSALQWVSGTNLAQGGSGSVHYVGVVQDATSTSLSFSMTFKILKAGAHTISTSTAEASDFDEVKFTPSKGSGTITGKTATTTPTTPENGNAQNNKDSNNKLSALQVYPGTLSPVFSADTTSYTVTVPADTTDVTISATAASSKATVSVSGGKDLKLGANEAKVIVVAENGSSRAYTLTIMCGEAEKIQIDGMEHTINEDFADEQIPTGFSRKQVTYNNRLYEAVVDASEKLTLVNLKNGEKTDFYVFDQEAQKFYNFVQISFSDGKYIVPLPLNRNIKEFTECEVLTIQVQEKAIEAWKINDEFSIAYVINQEGAEGLYKYDSVDGTFQRYSEADIEQTEAEPVEKTIFPDEYYMYAIVGLGALSLILFIAMIYFIASRKSRHEGRKRKAAKRLEKQRAKEEKKMAK